MKTKFASIISILLLTILLVSCSNDNSNKTTTKDSLNGLGDITQGDSLPSILEDAELVDGTNLAVYNSFSSLDLNFEQMTQKVVEFAQNSTICVENYQTVYQTTFVGPGHGWQQTTTHTLYGWGSGVIYYKALLTNGSYLYKVITNEHVVASDSYCVEGEEEYQIYDESYEINIEAHLLGSNEEADIAVLAFISDREYNAVSFESDDNIKAGSYVVAMGTPIDLEYYNTASFGFISKITESTIQHGATINSGNSGGPLFSLNGNLVGINNAKLSGQTSSGSTIEGIFFAIPKSIVISSVNGIVGTDEFN